jgi:phosphate transport system substrate-binding protein
LRLTRSLECGYKEKKETEETEMKRKVFLMVSVVVMVVVIFAACGGATNNDTPATNESTPAPVTNANESTPAPVTNETATNETLPVQAPTGTIHVITREAGSGTRDAFTEITGIHADGVDRTWDEAAVGTGTGAIITAIAENVMAMGYISLGALRDDVRAIPVNGVEATAENIIGGTYPLYRSFYLAVPSEISELAQDFIAFIESVEGQEIITANGYIATAENPQPFAGGGLTGSLEIEGSTSVSPLMNYIVAAYNAKFPGVTIDVHSTGSGAGITAAMDGRVDFGISSRALREGELAVVDSVTIAHDGIAVIINPTNGIPSVSVEEIRDIFMGELTRWEDIN